MPLAAYVIMLAIAIFWLGVIIGVCIMRNVVNRGDW